MNKRILDYNLQENAYKTNSKYDENKCLDGFREGEKSNV